MYFLSYYSYQKEVCKEELYIPICVLDPEVCKEELYIPICILDPAKERTIDYKD